MTHECERRFVNSGRLWNFVVLSLLLRDNAFLFYGLEKVALCVGPPWTERFIRDYKIVIVFDLLSSIFDVERSD